MKDWVRELKRNCTADMVIAIAGNKCDLNDLREVRARGKVTVCRSRQMVALCKHNLSINETFITSNLHMHLSRHDYLSKCRLVKIIFKIKCNMSNINYWMIHPLKLYEIEEFIGFFLFYT